VAVHRPVGGGEVEVFHPGLKQHLNCKGGSVILSTHIFLFDLDIQSSPSILGALSPEALRLRLQRRSATDGDLARPFLPAGMISSAPIVSERSISLQSSPSSRRPDMRGRFGKHRKAFRLSGLPILKAERQS